MDFLTALKFVLLSVCAIANGVPVDESKDSLPLETTSPSSVVENTTALNPKISYSRETLVDAGSSTVLDCGVEGIDLSGVDGFAVTWSKINVEKPTSSFPISKGDKVELFTSKYEIIHPEGTYQYSLKIKSAVEEDGGTYRCSVYFGHDQKIDADVPVIVRVAPYFIDASTKSLTVTLGDSLSVECSPGGVPTPTVHWEMNIENTTTRIENHILNIPFVEREHAGRYSCHAENGVGKPVQSAIELDVKFPPEVSVDQKKASVRVGDSITVVCRVESNPSANVEWRKEGQEVIGEQNIRTSQKYENGSDDEKVLSLTMTIENIEQDQIGVYTCVAGNSEGRTEVISNITMSSPPVIVRQSRRKVYYMDLDFVARSITPVTLECEAQGSPTPNYKWTKDGQPLFWQADDRMSLDPESGSLLIDSPIADDNGWYQCIAYNDLGVAKSAPIQLLDTTMAKFTNNSQKLELEAELGKPFNLTCENATGDPQPYVMWVVAQTISNEQNFLANFIEDVSNRTVMGPNGIAYFSHVTKEDDSFLNNITYFCAARQMATSNELTMGTTVKLRVVPPKNEQSNPVKPFVMYSSPEHVTLKGGQENKLWCIFGGESVSNITWSRVDGQPLIESNYNVTNNNATLHIKNTNMSHAVEYRCSAGDLTRTMRVAVEMPPALTDSLTSHTVAPGTHVVFQCSAEGTGVISYEWFHNGRPVSPDDSRKVQRGGNLTIRDASYSDIGNYACNASSLLGYAYGQSILNVIGDHKNLRENTEGCPEVEILRKELFEVKKNLAEMKEFLEFKQIKQDMSSLNLIQRIAAKLDILTTHEKKVFSSYNKEILSVDTHPQEIKADEKPEILYAENIPAKQSPKVEDGEEEKGETTTEMYGTKEEMTTEINEEVTSIQTATEMMENETKVEIEETTQKEEVEFDQKITENKETESQKEELEVKDEVKEEEKEA